MKTLRGRDLLAESLLGGALRNNITGGSEGGRNEPRNNLIGDAVTTKDVSTGSTGVGMTLQTWPRLRQEGWTFQSSSHGAGRLSLGRAREVGTIVPPTCLPVSLLEKMVPRILEELFPHKASLPYEACRSESREGRAAVVAMVYHPDPAFGAKKLNPHVAGSVGS